MAEPPSYEDSVSNDNAKHALESGDEKTVQKFTIREEVGLSRSQHVATLVSKLLPQIRERARQGVSRSTLLLLPSDQVSNSQKGELVGFSEDDRPIVIQLQGRSDETQFWTQEEALELLKDQLFTVIAGEAPERTIEPLPPRAPPLQKRSSMFGRKVKKEPEPVPDLTAKKAPVTVDVQLDQVHFRTETEYGLYETLRARAIMVTIDVR